MNGTIVSIPIFQHLKVETEKDGVQWWILCLGHKISWKLWSGEEEIEIFNDQIW